MEIWKGKLTVSNINEVAFLLQQMLDGKSYLIREIGFTHFSSPAETKEKRLTPRLGEFVEVYNDSSGASFMVRSEPSSWGDSIGPDDSNSTVLNPYIIFTGDSIVIQSRTGVTIIYDIQDVTV